jgi:hypothetical protein
MAQKYFFYRNIFLSYYRNIVSRVNKTLTCTPIKVKEGKQERKVKTEGTNC